MSKPKNSHNVHHKTFDLSQAIHSLILASSLVISPTIKAEDVSNKTTKHHYQISSGSLSHALSTFAGSSGILLSADAKLTDGKTSRGLEGEYTVEEGFTRLLAGTGLTHYFNGDNTVMLQATENQSSSDVETLPIVKVTGKVEHDPNDPYNTDYNRTQASTATKTDTPLMETPVSIQTITKQVMKDQQVIKVEDALKNVSSISVSDNNVYNGVNDEFIVRGFNTNNLYQDGFRLPDHSMAGKLDTANIERIDVVKGTAAMLYGRVEPGGLINTITKKPLAQPYYSLQQQFGSYDLYRTTIDATGPIPKNKDVLYRVNLAYENSGSFVDFVNRERVFFAPVITWNISPKTQANFNIQYQHNNQRPDPGIPVVGDRPGKFAKNLYLAQPYDRVNGDATSVGFDWSHAFNDDWKFTHQFNSKFTDIFSVQTLMNKGYYTPLQPGQTEVGQTTYVSNIDTKSYSTSLNLTGKVTTFGIKHNLLFGGDYYTNAWTGSPSTLTRSFDISMPVYTYQLPTDQLGNQYRYKVDEGWYGLYWQDQIKLPYGFNILGGLRYDYTSGSSNLNYDDGSFSLRSSAVQEKVSSRVGVLWEVRPELSLYGHYSEGLGNSNVGGFFTLPDGEKLKPEIATEWEFGAKTSLFDERITGSVAYFNLTKENIGTPDLQNPAFMKMTGEVVNRGVEVDVAGELLPGLNIIGSYAHLDSKITKDNSGNEGHRWVNTPEHSGSLWTTYSMQAGLLRGLKFGGGIFAKGARDGDLVNQYQLPGYVTVNLLTSYDWKIGKQKITTQLNVDNLLDKTYFSSSAFGANPVYYGQPRTFMGSVKVEF